MKRRGKYHPIFTPIPIFKNSKRISTAKISILTFTSVFAMLADTLHLDYVREYTQPVLECNTTKRDRSASVLLSVAKIGK